VGAKNKVISGDYLNKFIILKGSRVCISRGIFNLLDINKTNVVDYEVVDQESRKSAASAVGRGLAGGLLLGPVGVLAGLSAKNKGTHIIAVQFWDGKKSLLEVDDNRYKAIIKNLF
jgi:hypothetical protein